jgi:hypothetical protein
MNNSKKDLAAMESKGNPAPADKKADSSELFWQKAKLEKGTITSDEFSKLKNALVVNLN